MLLPQKYIWLVRGDLHKLSFSSAVGVKKKKLQHDLVNYFPLANHNSINITSVYVPRI